MRKGLGSRVSGILLSPLSCSREGFCAWRLTGYLQMNPDLASIFAISLLYKARFPQTYLGTQTWVPVLAASESASKQKTKWGPVSFCKLAAH